MMKLEPELNQYVIGESVDTVPTKSNHQEHHEKHSDKENNKEPNLYGVNYL